MRTLACYLSLCAALCAQTVEERQERVDNALLQARQVFQMQEQVSENLDKLSELTQQMQLLAETLLVASDRNENPEQLMTSVSGPSEFGPTPLNEIAFQLRKSPRPKPTDIVWDPGVGDARWLIQASLMFGCRGVGYEKDQQQFEAACQLVDEAGLSDKIEIVYGDALELGAPPDATIAVCYMRPDLLEALQPELSKMKLVISYLHEVPGLAMTASSDSYRWERPETIVQASIGRWVTRNVPCSQYGCMNPNCTMLTSKSFWEGDTQPTQQISTPAVRQAQSQRTYYYSNSRCRSGNCFRRWFGW